MIRPEAGPDRLAAVELSAKPVSDQVETVTAEPKLAFPRRFQLGQLMPRRTPWPRPTLLASTW
jgi:hypothetical protein